MSDKVVWIVALAWRDPICSVASYDYNTVIETADDIAREEAHDRLAYGLERSIRAAGKWKKGCVTYGPYVSTIGEIGLTADDIALLDANGYVVV